ncbi:ribosome maturation factor RimM [Petroclostridium sp. X23]|uniref:ribosome maturation factor RimM n=1 Tax=Petroclostridium sp. X23 TaxID=3045146 RepID=UPI0024AE5CAA|nr:ribosome maturation factor RimM [Petroclostridium sp. X23]WHH59424.1 ribosome maturation factor RimM [Petroclostridium sp. X23]
MRCEQLEVGKIVNTHGVRGSVKVIPLTDDPTRYEQLDWVYIQQNGKLEKIYIDDVKYQKNNIILKFRHVNTIDDAEKLKNKMLLIDRDKAVKLPENRYFICDLIGLEVKTQEGQYLGKISDVISTGSSDVYIIKPLEGKDILIPAIKEVVIQIDIDNNSMIVKPLEGLIE